MFFNKKLFSFWPVILQQFQDANKTVASEERDSNDDAASVPTILPPEGLPEPVAEGSRPEGLPLTSKSEGGDGDALDSKWRGSPFMLDFGSMLDTDAFEKTCAFQGKQTNWFDLESLISEWLQDWLDELHWWKSWRIDDVWLKIFLAPEQLKARLKRMAADQAPGLTVLNKLWWHMVDPLQPQLDHMVQIYWNGQGYLKTHRSQHHHAFHALAPAGSERWGTHAGSLAMAALTRDYYRSTGHAFTRTRAMLWWRGFTFGCNRTGTMPFGSTPWRGPTCALASRRTRGIKSKGHPTSALWRICLSCERSLCASFVDFKDGEARPPGNFTNSMVTRICPIA